MGGREHGDGLADPFPRPHSNLFPAQFQPDRGPVSVSVTACR